MYGYNGNNRASNMFNMPNSSAQLFPNSAFKSKHSLT